MINSKLLVNLKFVRSLYVRTVYRRLEGLSCCLFLLILVCYVVCFQCIMLQNE